MEETEQGVSGVEAVTPNTSEAVSPNTSEAVEPTKQDSEKVEEEGLVVGIDIGTKQVVSALSSKGYTLPVVLLNNLSNRLTPNVVSFREERRLIGEEGLTCITRAPQSTVHSLKTLIGLPLEDTKKEALENFLLVEILHEDDQVKFKLDHCGDFITVSPEHIIAMMLKQSLHFASQLYPLWENHFKGCVLAVPMSYTSKQKKALLDAAAIIDLNVLKIIHETTAVALTHAFKYWNPKPTESKSPKVEESTANPDAEVTKEIEEKVLIVDMGHSYLSAQVVSITPSNMQILAGASDPTLGARNFDIALTNYFVDEINQKLKVDVRKNARSLARLVLSCEKTKKVLSTIDETFLEVENINDQDYKSKISRKTFESLSTPLNALSIGQFISTLLQSAEVTPNDLASVEIVGGGTRVPMIQQWISQAVGGKELSRTLDSTSSVAVGCGLMARILLDGSYVVDDSKLSSSIEDTGMSVEQINKAKQAEEEMNAKDEKVVATSNKRNEIEKFLMDTRERCGDKEFDAVILEEQKQKMFAVLDRERYWVDDNRDSTLDVYSSKLTAVQQEIHDICPALTEYLEKVKEDQKKALLEAEAIQSAEDRPSSFSKDRPLTKQQKMSEAQKKKHQGNLLFKDFDYAGAASRYTKALSFLSDMWDLSDAEKKEVNEIKIPCHLNLAICCMKLERYVQAADNCSSALAIDADNVKALFRRGTSYAALKRYEDSKKDLTAALKLAPKDGAVRKELLRVTELLKKQTQQQKQMFSKMFG